MRIVAYLRRHHVGLLALFIALGGTTAYATHAPDLTTTEDIRDGEVQNQDLGADSVSSAKIQTQAVTTGDLAPNSVTSSRIPNDAVGTSEIGQGSVFNADLAANSITDTRIAADAVGSSELKNDAVGANEVAAESLGDDDIRDVVHRRETLTDGTDDGFTAAILLDQAGALSVQGRCSKGATGLIGSIDITGGLANWSMDSNAPNGHADQVGLGVNAARTLVRVGITPDRHFQGGDFAAMSDVAIDGHVTVQVNRTTDGCDFIYSRSGE